MHFVGRLHTINGPVFINSVKFAVELVSPTINIGGNVSDGAAANFTTTFGFNPTINVRTILADVDDEILLHESIHVLNSRNGVSADPRLDEQTAYGISELLTGHQPLVPRTLELLQQFEMRHTGIGPFPNGVYAEFQNTIYLEANNSTRDLSGLAGAMQNIRWVDPDDPIIVTAGGQRQAKFINLTDADWQAIQDNSLINISCAEIANSYSFRLGLSASPLECPDMPQASSIE